MAHFIWTDTTTGKPEVKGVEKAVQDDEVPKHDKLIRIGEFKFRSAAIITKGSASG